MKGSTKLLIFLVILLSIFLIVVVWAAILPSTLSCGYGFVLSSGTCCMDENHNNECDLEEMDDDTDSLRDEAWSYEAERDCLWDSTEDIKRDLLGACYSGDYPCTDSEDSMKKDNKACKECILDILDSMYDSIDWCQRQNDFN